MVNLETLYLFYIFCVFCILNYSNTIIILQLVEFVLYAVIRTEIISIYSSVPLCVISKISKGQNHLTGVSNALHKCPCLSWVIVKSQISLFIHKIKVV